MFGLCFLYVSSSLEPKKLAHYTHLLHDLEIDWILCMLMTLLAYDLLLIDLLSLHSLSVRAPIYTEELMISRRPFANG